MTPARFHSMARWRPIRLAAALALMVPGTARAQATITLADALDAAETAAFANRAARAATDATSARALAARRGILPSVRLEAGFLRTTDPVGAFGTTLRQQRLTPADFDPDRLNFPAPLNNHSGAVVLEQPVVMPEAWFALRAGSQATASAQRAAEWTSIATQADVVRAWFGVVLAAEQAVTLTAATRAAQAHVTQAEHMLEAGMVTRSDVLLAAVRAGELDASRIQAIGDSALATQRLAVLLGKPHDAPLRVAAAFPGDDAVVRMAREVEDLPVGSRADVDAARLGVRAASADIDRTRAALLPRIASFVRRDLHSSDAPFRGAGNWTVGVMASWTPFTGASELSEQRLAAAQQRGAMTRLDGVTAEAGLALEETRVALATATARLGIARQAVAQSAEAHRIVTRKYEGGLATVAELLDAAAAETQAQLGLSAARFGLLTAMADRLRAIGAEPSRLTLLDPR